MPPRAPIKIPIGIHHVKCRFWMKVHIKSRNECWNWTAYRTTKTEKHQGGYGRFSFQGRLYMAHRVAVILGHMSVDVPPRPLNGEVVIHCCDNPSCCNPLHLVDGSASENTKDMHNKGRHHPADDVPF